MFPDEMTTLRSLSACTIVAILVSTCVGAPEEAEPAPTEEIAENVDPVPEATEFLEWSDEEDDETADFEQFPCSVITQDEIERLLGNAVEPAVFAREEITENGETFSAEVCSWLSFEDGANEATLWVSQPEHFPGGEIACELPDVDEETLVLPTPDLGTQAWWIHDQSAGVGSLLACSSQLRVQIDIASGTQGQALALQVARALVSQVLEAA